MPAKTARRRKQQSSGAELNGHPTVPGPAPKMLVGKAIESAGVISAFEAYTVRELFRRFGFSRRGLLKAREKGLKFCRLGRRTTIRGAALLQYMELIEE